MHTQRGRRPLLAVLLVAFVLLTMPLGDPALDRPAAAAVTEGVSPAPRDFVTLQYQDFLTRNPDEAGLAFWAARLEDGADPGDLIDSMVSAPEFARIVAPLARLYQAYYLRTPDYEGLHFWSGRLRAGWTLTDVSAYFAGASEFTQRYGSLDNGRFVELIYRNVLGREPDAAGLAFWVGRLDRGASRGSVMIGFSESSEYTRATLGRVRAVMLYLGMLKRTPDEAGLAFWASRIDGGASYGSVVRSFLASPEYQSRLANLLTQRHPLTGLATVGNPDRPALVMKIDDAPLARPQIALNQADVVYEEMVEGTVTRFMALFQSQTPAAAGPVRSIRTTDFALLAPLNRPLVGASGANAVILRQLQSEPVVDVTALVAGSAYYRVADRRSPHNLLATPTRLWALAPAGSIRPPTLFDHRNPQETLNPNAVPAAGVDVSFGKTSVSYRWSLAGWARVQNGTAHVDSVGRQITPDNVVVMQTDYRVSPADPESPEAVTVGSGPVWVFTRGHRIDGTWSRRAANELIVFTDRQGNRIELTPGITWVELAPPGTIALR